MEIYAGVEHRGGFVLSADSMFPPPETFVAIGGSAAVAKLVDGLYDRFEADPVLRPAFGHDLTRERANQKIFFETWFGGRPAYYDEGWRTGLRHRHERISISAGMAGRWVGHFLDSFAEVTKDPSVVAAVKPIVSRLAMALVNRPNEPVKGEAVRQRCSSVGHDKVLRQIQLDDPLGIARDISAYPNALDPRLLLTAAVKGKVNAVTEFLRLGLDVNTPAALSGADSKTNGIPDINITPLCGAIAKGRSGVVKVLLDHGAKYDIFTAAFLGDLDSVREILERAPELVDVNDPACDLARVTPLLHAVAAGRTEMARLLLDQGATLGSNSVRLLDWAACAGNEGLTDLLLEHGADAGGMMVGHWVSYPSIAEKLLARGADVNRPPAKWIGLSCTGNSGHNEREPLVRNLLRHGADVKARYAGRTAMHCAAQASFLKVIDALIEYGADVNALDDRGRTPLDVVNLAGKSIDKGVVRRFLWARGARSVA